MDSTGEVGARSLIVGYNVSKLLGEKIGLMAGLEECIIVGFPKGILLSTVDGDADCLINEEAVGKALDDTVNAIGFIDG